MQSLLQQMGDNPSLMSNLMSAPYTRNMLEALAADPNMAANVSWKLGFVSYREPT